MTIFSKGLGRNYRFWIEQIIRNMLTTVLFTIIMPFFMEIQDDNPGFIKRVLGDMPMYLILFSIIMTVAFAVGYIQTYFPMSVALNARRNQSLFAMSTSLLVYEAVSFALAFVIEYAVNCDVRVLLVRIIPHAIGLMFVLAALSNGLAILLLRVNRTVAIIVYVILILAASLGMGLFVGFKVAVGKVDFLVNALNVISTNLFAICFLVGGVVLFSISLWGLIKATKKLELKF